VDEESFSDGLLEYPHYTRPAVVDGAAVPEVLQSGNHEAIRRWRRTQALTRTAERRPDLLARRLPAEDRELLAAAGQGLLAQRTYVALLHYPVLDCDGATVTTSVTNMDIHDIARSSATFGLAGYFIVTPIDAQRELVARVVGNWAGGPRFDERGVALAQVRAVASLADVITSVSVAHGGRAPCLVATSARWSEPPAGLPPAALRAERAAEPERPMVVVFGTGHGVTAEVLAVCDRALTPIEGISAFNHLSVRAAAAILLDRLFGFA
jgi:tRNA (guanine37-N1)-methyltransferase